MELCASALFIDKLVAEIFILRNSFADLFVVAKSV